MQVEVDGHAHVGKRDESLPRFFQIGFSPEKFVEHCVGRGISVVLFSKDPSSLEEYPPMLEDYKTCLRELKKLYAEYEEGNTPYNPIAITLGHEFTVQIHPREYEAKYKDNKSRMSPFSRHILLKPRERRPNKNTIDITLISPTVEDLLRAEEELYIRRKNGCISLERIGEVVEAEQSRKEGERVFFVSTYPWLYFADFITPDIVEVYNGMIAFFADPNYNKLSREYAQINGLPETCGSDPKVLSDVGRTHFTMPTDSLTPQDMINAILYSDKKMHYGLSWVSPVKQASRILYGKFNNKNETH